VVGHLAVKGILFRFELNKNIIRYENMIGDPCTVDKVEVMEL
jgi:hypothetical protein